jgi:hypothetical protein
MGMWVIVVVIVFVALIAGAVLIGGRHHSGF